MKTTYLNIRTFHVVETVDQVDESDFPSFREYRAEVRRLCQEYRLAGMPVYTSSRATKEWTA